MKILDFPVIRQSSIDSCSCACVQSCLCYFGFNHRENQIRNLMRIGKNPQEIHPRKIVAVLKHFGLKATYRKLTIDDLIDYLNRDIPVILNIQAWAKSKKPDWNSDNNGHYAVAVGYDNKKKRIIFSDPSSFIEPTFFMENWRKDGMMGTLKNGIIKTLELLYMERMPSIKATK